MALGHNRIISAFTAGIVLFAAAWCFCGPVMAQTRPTDTSSGKHSCCQDPTDVPLHPTKPMDCESCSWWLLKTTRVDQPTTIDLTPAPAFLATLSAVDAPLHLVTLNEPRQEVDIGLCRASPLALHCQLLL